MTSAEDKLKHMVGDLAFQVAVQTARAEAAEAERDTALATVRQITANLSKQVDERLSAASAEADR